MEKTEIEAKPHLCKDIGFPNFIHLSLYEVILILFNVIFMQILMLFKNAFIGR